VLFTVVATLPGLGWNLGHQLGKQATGLSYDEEEEEEEDEDEERHICSRLPCAERPSGQPLTKRVWEPLLSKTDSRKA
jgi:hypothetical protein